MAIQNQQTAYSNLSKMDATGNCINQSLMAGCICALRSTRQAFTSAPDGGYQMPQTNKKKAKKGPLSSE